jgi:putative OmpL-like beta-barrel porin-2
MRRIGLWVLAAALAAGWATPAWAQAPPAAPEKPKTLWEEHVLFAYIENSYVWNLGHTGRDDVNELRFYDFDAGYSFNMAEFSIKKDTSDRYPFGYGLVVTGGLDSQKNHAIGICRDKNDNFPFRNTSKFDLQEAYGSYKIPVGSGLTLKAGKFVTLLGYEVIESPLNLNFSRSFLTASRSRSRTWARWPAMRSRTG